MRPERKSENAMCHQSSSFLERSRYLILQDGTGKREGRQARAREIPVRKEEEGKGVLFCVLFVIEMQDAYTHHTSFTHSLWRSWSRLTLPYTRNCYALLGSPYLPHCTSHGSQDYTENKETKLHVLEM